MREMLTDRARVKYALAMQKLLSWTLLTLFQTTGTPGAAGPMTLYHDAATDVSYRYPSDFVTSQQLSSALEKVRAQSTGDASEDQARRCISFPLVLERNLSTLNTNDVGLILLRRIDHSCFHEPAVGDQLGEEAQRTMQLLRAFGRPMTEDAVTYKLVAHDSAFAQGSAAAKALGEGKMMHGGAACTLIGQNTLCWLIASSNYKEMPSLVSTPVSIAGGAEAPLVPKDLIQRW